MTLVDRLVPQTGYPCEVEIEVSYTLFADGGCTPACGHGAPAAVPHHGAPLRTPTSRPAPGGRVPSEGARGPGAHGRHEDHATDRTGLAVEPMTCGSDAFDTGHDLIVLGPGAEHVALWTLTAIEATSDSRPPGG